MTPIEEAEQILEGLRTQRYSREYTEELQAQNQELIAKLRRMRHERDIYRAKLRTYQLVVAMAAGMFAAYVVEHMADSEFLGIVTFVLVGFGLIDLLRKRIDRAINKP